MRRGDGLRPVEVVQLRRGAAAEDLRAGQRQEPDAGALAGRAAEPPGGGTGARAPLPRAVLHALARQVGYRGQHQAFAAAGGQERLQLLQGPLGKGVLQPHNIGEHQPDDRDRQPAVRLRQVPVQRADIRPADHPSGKLCYGTQPCNPLPPAGCGQERQQPAGLHHRGLRGHGEQGFADPQTLTAMIRKFIVKAQDWADGKLRRLAGRISPDMRVAIILVMLAAFGALSVYMTVASIYRIGRNDGKELGIEHVRRLQLPNDSIINPFESGRHGTGGEVE